MILSSLVAVPVDTALFLWLALGASIDLWPSVLVVSMSKLAALAVVALGREDAGA